MHPMQHGSWRVPNTKRSLHGLRFVLPRLHKSVMAELATNRISIEYTAELAQLASSFNLEVQRPGACRTTDIRGRQQRVACDA